MRRISSLLLVLIAVGCQQSTAPNEQIFSNAEYAGNVSSLYAIGASSDAAIPTDFKWRDSTGKVHALSEYKGRIVLLNFWATWCSNCTSEMPALQDIADHSTEPVTVIGVSTDNTGHSFTTVRDYVTTHNIGYQIVVDSSMNLFINYFAAANGQSATPQTFIIGKDWKIKALLLGAQSKETFEAEIAKMK